MKRAMNPLEKFHVDRLCSEGCWITRSNAEWHHWLTNLNGVGITRCHLFGAPLAPELHRLGSQSVHVMGDEAKFCELHGIDKQRSIDEIAVSMELFFTSRPGLRLV